MTSHTSCPDCGSSDALTVYEDGHTYCFSCQKYHKTAESEGEVTPSDLITYDIMSLNARGLKEKVCKKYGYGVGYYQGKPCHVANYYRGSKKVAQKLRFKDKTFKILGDFDKIELFGQQLCKGEGKRLVITEGEIDCLSVSQAFNCSWDAVSIPGGAQAAAKAIKNNLKFVTGYDDIVLAFDRDEAGIAATEKVLELLPIDKTRVVAFPEDIKDFNDLLKQNRQSEITSLVFNAKPYSPENIIDASEVTLDDIIRPMRSGISLPFPKLNDMLYGLRKGEITLVTAGSGIGKTTFFRELQYHTLKSRPDIKVGIIHLEESIVKVLQGLISLDVNIPLCEFRHRQAYDKQLVKTSYEYFTNNKRLYLYNHFGSLRIDTIIKQIEYMSKALGCDYIFLDHVSMVVSGTKTDNERKDLDVLMTSLASLVENTNIGLVLISHLKRTGGKVFNEGATVSLTDLRGSAALEQLSHNVISLERNQQSEEEGDLVQLRVLKSRETGYVGKADVLRYDKNTGRLVINEDLNKMFKEVDETGFQV